MGGVQRRYRKELDALPDEVVALRAQLGKGTATLLYQSKEEALNNAVALQAYLEGRAVL